MSEGERQIRTLARAVGLANRWQDVEGEWHEVATDDLAAILQALDYPAGTAADRKRSRDRLVAERDAAPTFLSGDVGRSLALPRSLRNMGTATIRLESGGTLTVDLGAGRLPAQLEPGYHRLHIQDREITLAIAPARCHALGGGPAWGPAIQIPSLRGDSPFGTFDDLRQAAGLFAQAGADLVAISPVHALYPGGKTHFSPYAPSSRLFLNSALAIAPAEAASGDLIDWPHARDAALAQLREAFDALSQGDRQALEEHARQHPALKRHALFDALHLRHDALPWQDWPPAFHDPEGSAARDFARDNPDEVALHIFAQVNAERRLAAAQEQARVKGMRIGLIADLAVGVDPGGSDVWSNPEAFLRHLTIGAPPDPLGPTGQNWGLTTFSPAGLRSESFAPWIATIRAALRHAGGLRIDHIFGLQRLWIIPEGAKSSRGAYLSYPVDDLLRILTLESHRAGSVIVGENLGTPPEGFGKRMAARGIIGMKVLWFERTEDEGFAAPSDYPHLSMAMTGTHDTPTVAGWWQGRDLEWQAGFRSPQDMKAATTSRRRDRKRLWKRLAGEALPFPEVASDQVVDAAIAHVAAAPSQLKVVPMEDYLGLEDQPNMPGTLDEHPNWRRRLPDRIENLLKRPDVARRAAMLRQRNDVPEV